MMLAPVPSNETERLHSLYSYGVLDTPPEEAFDQITRLIRSMLGTSIALINLVDASRLFVKSASGLDLVQTPRDSAFCAHTILQEDLLVIEDTTEDARFNDNPYVTNAPWIRFYAGAPLRSSAGHAIGSLCALDDRPRRWSAKESVALRSLARIASDQLEFRLLGKRLGEQLDERTRMEEILRRSRKRLEGFLETASDYLWETNGDFELTFFAGGAGRDRSRQDAILGKPIWQVFGSDALDEQSWAVHLRRGVGFRGLQGTLTDDHGERRRFEISGAPICDADGSVTGFRGTSRDVTERYRLEQLKNDFISNVSHELRTPLTSARGALGLVLGGKTGDLPDRARSLLQLADRNVDSLSRLVNDILDFEKASAGLIDLNCVPTEVAAVVGQAIETILPYAAPLNVEICRSGEPWPATVIAIDADRIKQVLTNLLSNAAKFSPPGSAVDVAVGADETHVTITVRDRGPGIPPEFSSRVFERFAQAREMNLARRGGTGLGLSIAKAFVEVHGGSIGFDSPLPDGGTRFWFTLPLPQRACG